MLYEGNDTNRCTDPGWTPNEAIQLNVVPMLTVQNVCLKKGSGSILKKRLFMINNICTPRIIKIEPVHISQRLEKKNRQILKFTASSVTKIAYTKLLINGRYHVLRELSDPITQKQVLRAVLSANNKKVI